MKILIDYFSLSYATGGIKTYITNILKNISEFDNFNKYTLLDFKKSATNVYAFGKENFNVINCNLISPKIYKYLTYFFDYPPLDMFVKEKQDITFFTNFAYYPVKTKKILTIHDLSFKYHPQFVSEKNRIFLNRTVNRSAKKMDKIITISNSVKNELMKEFDLRDDDIEVVYPSVDKRFFKVQKDDDKIIRVKEKYQIKKEYFLFTSTLEPRKNINGIINAYMLLPDEIKNKYSLVLAGGKGWQDEEILENLKKAKKEGADIIQTGFVEATDLPVLYSAAYLFLYLSFYEGFGIPILEAMSCGAPVITSNTTSMPEAAGDAALLVDPNDTIQIKNAIIKLVDDKVLRENLVSRGFKEIEKFSWEESAKKLINIFESLK